MMDDEEARKRQLIQLVAGEISRATGRIYQIDLEALDERSLRELLRLVRDLVEEKHAAVRRARIYPWRR